MSRTEQQLFDDKHRERKKKETVHYYDRWTNREEKDHYSEWIIQKIKKEQKKEKESCWIISNEWS